MRKIPCDVQIWTSYSVWNPLLLTFTLHNVNGPIILKCKQICFAKLNRYNATVPVAARWRDMTATCRLSYRCSCIVFSHSYTYGIFHRHVETIQIWRRKKIAYCVIWWIFCLYFQRRRLNELDALNSISKVVLKKLIVIGV